MLIYWTDVARAAILEMKEVLIRKHSPWRAQDVFISLFEQVKQLADFPETGQLYRQGGIEHVRQLIVDDYRILYYVGEQRLDILTINYQV